MIKNKQHETVQEISVTYEEIRTASSASFQTLLSSPKERDKRDSEEIKQNMNYWEKTSSCETVTYVENEQENKDASMRF